MANRVVIPALRVIEAGLAGGTIQCLVGRDVLQHSIFINTGTDNSFTFSV